MYSQFAEFYDELTDDVGYEARSKYLCSLFEKFDRTPTLLLDLACGTGGFSREFAKKNISVIGVDISEEMLAVAVEKNFEDGLDILYLCQDAAELDLYGTVDGAICSMDSLNHITDIKDLKKAVSRVSLFLEEGCLFIFDVNTIYKHEKVLADNTFVIDEDGIYCVWQNEFKAEKLTTHIYLDFFTEQEDGSYLRFGEEFPERAYTHEELEDVLKESGLEILEVFGDMTEESPENDCEREIYVVKKRS